jgi:preprotein translocase subunit SecA
MFEAMMLRFQEDTCRNLFRMQILGPNQEPIETLEQLAQLRASAPPPPPAPPARPDTIFNALSNGTEGEVGFSPLSNGRDNGASASAAPHTTIDKLEREFQRTKQRDLAAAAQAGGTAVATQRRTTNEVGRNDACPCGSGKKYKKCHGA